MLTKIPGTLEIDHDSGIVRFEASDDKRIVLRLSGLRVPVPSIIARTFTIIGGSGVQVLGLDVSAMEMNWSGVRGVVPLMREGRDL